MKPSLKNAQIRVRLRRSPNASKKWRVELLDTGKHVDFGQAGASDFTLHGDAPRMIRYLIRHAARVPDSLHHAAKNGAESASLVQRALEVRTSRRERWGDVDVLAAVHTAGFWSRWLLWSLPSLSRAKALIRERFNVVFE